MSGISTCLKEMRKALQSSERIVVITGAGISTDSGLPDYRSPGRPKHNPIQHQDFVRKLSSRQRYWARSFFGYPFMIEAQYNPGHQALSHAYANGRLSHVITQNVDGLHQKSGIAANGVTELHGSIHQVICLDCGDVSARSDMQRRIGFENPDLKESLDSALEEQQGMNDDTTNNNIKKSDQEMKDNGPNDGSLAYGASRMSGVNNYQKRLQQTKLRHNDHSNKNRNADARPDGDIELVSIEDYSSVTIPDCIKCGGMLKPNMVFFGDNVPRLVADTATKAIEQADFVLTLGTTLSTWSAFRLLRLAHQRQVDNVDNLGNSSYPRPLLGILNDGFSRGDDQRKDKVSLNFRSHARLSEALPLLFGEDR